MQPEVVAWWPALDWPRLLAAPQTSMVGMAGKAACKAAPGPSNQPLQVELCSCLGAPGPGPGLGPPRCQAGPGLDLGSGGSRAW